MAEGGAGLGGASEQAAEGEGEAGVNEDEGAEGGETGDELSGPAEGLSGVEVAEPGAGFAAGGLVGVADVGDGRAGVRIEDELGGGEGRFSGGVDGGGVRFDGGGGVGAAGEALAGRPTEPTALRRRAGGGERRGRPGRG